MLSPACCRAKVRLDIQRLPWPPTRGGGQDAQQVLSSCAGASVLATPAQEASGHHIAMSQSQHHNTFRADGNNKKMIFQQKEAWHSGHSPGSGQPAPVDTPMSVLSAFASPRRALWLSEPLAFRWNQPTGQTPKPCQESPAPGAASVPSEPQLPTACLSHKTGTRWLAAFAGGLFHITRERYHFLALWSLHKRFPRESYHFSDLPAHTERSASW